MTSSMDFFVSSFYICIFMFFPTLDFHLSHASTVVISLFFAQSVNTRTYIHMSYLVHFSITKMTISVSVVYIFFCVSQLKSHNSPAKQRWNTKMQENNRHEKKAKDRNERSETKTISLTNANPYCRAYMLVVVVVVFGIHRNYMTCGRTCD